MNTKVSEGRPSGAIMEDETPPAELKIEYWGRTSAQRYAIGSIPLHVGGEDMLHQSQPALF